MARLESWLWMWQAAQLLPRSSLLYAGAAWRPSALNAIGNPGFAALVWHAVQMSSAFVPWVSLNEKFPLNASRRTPETVVPAVTVTVGFIM